jgi:hypothetical protein
MSRLSSWAVAVLALTTGCCFHAGHEAPQSSSNVVWSFAFSDGKSEPPVLALPPTEIARALARAERASQRRRDRVRDGLDRAEPIAVEGVADALRVLYAAGERDAAEELAARHRGVATWDHSDELVSIDCHYRQNGWVGGALELKVQRRAGVEGPLAIAFPPGTYGVGEPLGRIGDRVADSEGEGRPRWTNPDDDRRYGHWPAVQDLACLQAPIILLPAGQEVATVMVPIACASFERASPRPDMVYTLHRFERGSAVDKLLVALCAGDDASESEAQLAVWLARNDITWDQFVREGGARGRIVTFGSCRPVLPRDAQGAASFLIRSGVDPGKARFFGHVDPLPPSPATDARTSPTPTTVTPSPSADARAVP